MRKYFTILSVVLGVTAYGQTNIFPASGNVGIGTTNPQVTLDVNGNIRASQKVLIGSNLAIYDEGGYTLYSGGGSGNRHVFFGNASWQTISSGNIQSNNGIFGFNYFMDSISIGCNHPIEKLHIQDGSILVKKARTGANSELALVYGTQHPFASIGYAGLYLYEDGDAGWGQASGLSFKTSVNDATPTTSMIIRGSGNVGIGTTNPTTKLAVNGIITTKEVNVTATGWADYVFDSSYELKSLAVVASYIQQNRHLPNIPSAEEVSKNGIALGEMNKKLLEKVEELTLYAIQQDTESKKLKAKSTQQKELLQTQSEDVKQLKELLQKQSDLLEKQNKRIAQLEQLVELPKAAQTK